MTTTQMRAIQNEKRTMETMQNERFIPRDVLTCNNTLEMETMCIQLLHML